MEGAARGSSNSPPPFLTKTHDMVDDPSTDSIVSWSPGGASFVVWNQPEFTRDLLPKFFKHSNFSSFVRQLNTYGFRKVDPDRWEFANEEFIRGQRQLLQNIHRRKPVHSHSLHSTSGPLSEEEKQELEDEIERLKQEKAALINELQNHAQLQHGMEHQMQSLEERVLVLEKRQRGLMDFLKRVVQEPRFLSDLLQQSDLQRKKRRLPKIVFLNEDTMEEDDQIVAFQPMSRERPDMFSMQALDVEPFEKMESSLNSLENLFRCVSQASEDDMFYDNIEPCLQSDVFLNEMNASAVENDANLQVPLPALRPHSPGSEYNSSSQDRVECSSHVDPLVLCATENETDLRSKVAVIVVNLEPAAAEVDSSRDQTPETTSSTVPTGVNDVFWEQFLTEIPGSSNTQEVESKRRDPDDKQSEGKMREQESTWWNRKYVDHHAVKMGI